LCLETGPSRGAPESQVWPFLTLPPLLLLNAVPAPLITHDRVQQCGSKRDLHPSSQQHNPSNRIIKQSKSMREKPDARPKKKRRKNRKTKRKKPKTEKIKSKTDSWSSMRR